MKRTLASLTLVLSVLWLLFSGMWTHPILVPLGAVSVALTVWLTWRLGIVQRSTDPSRLALPSIRYWPWLMVQIVRANLQVVARVFQSVDRLSPTLATVRISQRTDVGRSIMANSITLTPGTVTLEVHEDRIEYYAMSEELVDELNAGDMDRRVTRLEKEL